LGMNTLISDTEWWIQILGEWSINKNSGAEYPILTAESIVEDNHRLVFLQSDASGDDGFGYFYGDLQETNPRYFSSAWTEEFSFINSHHGELEALRHFVEVTTQQSVILVWISDCLSAVWSVNKGRCRSEEGRRGLIYILTTCDAKRVQLIALWLPREHNLLADYLSHFSSYVGRESAEGRVDNLEFEDSGRRKDGGPQEP